VMVGGPMILRSIKQRAHRTSAVGETAGGGGWMTLRSIKQRAHRTSAVGETAGGGGWSLLNVITTGLKSASVNDLSGT